MGKPYWDDDYGSYVYEDAWGDKQPIHGYIQVESAPIEVKQQEEIKEPAKAKKPVTITRICHKCTKTYEGAGSEFPGICVECMDKIMDYQEKEHNEFMKELKQINDELDACDEK